MPPWKRTAAYYAVPWRGKWETELGGVLVTHAIHSHDIMTYLMGPIASVFSRRATRVNPIEVEDCAVASLQMKSGALVSLAATLGSQVEISRLRFCFEHVTFESSLAPYSPGDDPWTITPASPEAEGRIAEALADPSVAKSPPSTVAASANLPIILPIADLKRCTLICILLRAPQKYLHS